MMKWKEVTAPHEHTLIHQTNRRTEKAKQTEINKTNHDAIVGCGWMASHVCLTMHTLSHTLLHSPIHSAAHATRIIARINIHYTNQITCMMCKPVQKQEKSASQATTVRRHHRRGLIALERFDAYGEFQYILNIQDVVRWCDFGDELAQRYRDRWYSLLRSATHTHACRVCSVHRANECVRKLD